MKARIKENGKWITVDTCNEGFYDVETHEIYEPDELAFDSGFDWSVFRREAAKVAMQGILASGDDGWSLTLTECYKPEEKHSYPIGIARFAVACADALIKQLKEK